MSKYNDETNPFTYSKNQNYFAKTLRQINESLELNEKDIRTLSIFLILRIADLALTYIFYSKRNAYHLIRFIDYILLFISAIVTALLFVKKEKLKYRDVVLSIFFMVVFITFDILSFLFYFLLKVRKNFILISLIVNELWMVFTSALLFKISTKLMAILKNQKKGDYNRSTHSNSSCLRKTY